MPAMRLIAHHVVYIPLHGANGGLKNRSLWFFSGVSKTSLAYCEVLHVQLQLFDLLGVLVPGIVLHYRDIDVDQLASKSGELVVDAHGIVAAWRDLVRVICSSLPLVGLHHLTSRIADCETSHAIASSHHLENRSV